MTIVDGRIEHVVRVEAPPAVVFGYFTDPDRHATWMGRDATLDPRPGGTYRCVVPERATISGRYLEVDPPHRVVFTWGFEGNETLPPGSSTVSVTLTADGSATLVRLVHTGLPHPAVAPHDQGWTGYLQQLAEAAGMR